MRELFLEFSCNQFPRTQFFGPDWAFSKCSGAELYVSMSCVSTVIAVLTRARANCNFESSEANLTAAECSGAKPLFRSTPRRADYISVPDEHAIVRENIRLCLKLRYGIHCIPVYALLWHML